jgi:hypothetical protein
VELPDPITVPVLPLPELPALLPYPLPISVPDVPALTPLPLP